jgi:hypothetical protein
MTVGVDAMKGMGVVEVPRNMYWSVGGKIGSAGLTAQELGDKYTKHQSEAGEFSTTPSPTQPTPPPPPQLPPPPHTLKQL